MNITAIEPAVLDPKTLKIRELNDRLRNLFYAPWLGKVVMTPTVAALDSAALNALIVRVQHFDNFTEGNDPNGEHDFGAVEQDGETYYFKIDYYDSKLAQGSEAPENPAVTCRVLTIMHRDEY